MKDIDLIDVDPERAAAVEIAAVQLREQIYTEVAETIRQNGIRGLRIGLTIGFFVGIILSIGATVSLILTGII